MADKTSIFRKKSMERATSPEQLNDYIKVANPGMWMILLAIVVFLTGVIIWGAFGELETTVEGAAVVKDGGIVFYVPERRIREIQAGQTVRIGEGRYTVEAVGGAPVEIDESFDIYLVHAGGFEKGEWVYAVTLAGTGVPEGVYEGEVVTDSVSPLSFIMN